MNLKFWESEEKRQEKKTKQREERKIANLNRTKRRSGCNAGIEYSPNDGFYDKIKLLNTNSFAVKILVKEIKIEPESLYIGEGSIERSRASRSLHGEVTVDYFMLSPGKTHLCDAMWGLSHYLCFIVESVDSDYISTPVVGIIKTNDK